MMENGPVPDRAEPDNTAVRTALWRALHVLADPPPHVFEDEVGLKLVAPDDGWRERPDMSAFTRPFRASILARARFIEDLVAEQTARGIDQYVILGAGLDTFAQRRPELASRMQVFEIDQPGPQAWKRQRLMETGYGVPPYLHLVPVDFEAGDAWWDKLGSSGFDASRPAIVASAGVSMYLTRDAIMATLRRRGAHARFHVRDDLHAAHRDARSRHTPRRRTRSRRSQGQRHAVRQFFHAGRNARVAREAGFKQARHVSAAALAQRYFAGRTDGLRPPDDSEELLVAIT